MITQRIRTRLARFSTFSLVASTLLVACSKPEEANLTPISPAQYDLKEIRYFIKQDDRVDTTTLYLKGSSVQNVGTVASTQQVEEGFGDLVKTSRFIVDPTSQLPNGADLSKFAVSVPEHWYGNGLFDRSIETYSLSTVETQKPYGFDSKRLVTVNIPPRARVDISRQITAYSLVCSFTGILENTMTGQRYNVTGKWTGLLQYASPLTTLKESAL